MGLKSGRTSFAGRSLMDGPPYFKNMSKYIDSLQKFSAYQKKESAIDQERIMRIVPSDLNEDQAKCYNDLINYIQEDTGEMLLLQGYAGTGKTYLITKFIEYILKSRKNQMIAMTGTTNKCVKVLRKASSIRHECIAFSTIHSLLGLREHITEQGDQIFVETITDTPNILNFKFLIIDEVSMLSDDLFVKIEKYRSKIKIGNYILIPPKIGGIYL